MAKKAVCCRHAAVGALPAESDSERPPAQDGVRRRSTPGGEDHPGKESSKRGRRLSELGCAGRSGEDSQTPVAPIFVVTERRKPVLLIECKWTDAEVDRSLRYLKARFPGAAAWQLSAIGKKNFVTGEGIRVAPALALLSDLI
jgi:hypothetical protein